MSLVVSDASPLHYLILCEAVDILPRLFDQVIVPRTVFHELQHEKTPRPVREWVKLLPTWATVRTGDPITTSVAIDAGEREALGLALTLRADAVLMDERDGRRVARELGILAIGTMGVLEAAALRGLVDLPAVIAKLRQTNIYLDEDIIRSALDRVASAKRQAE